MVLLLAATFLLISVVSYEVTQGPYRFLSDDTEVLPVSGPVGPAGHFVGALLTGAMGWMGLMPILLLTWLAYHFWTLDRKEKEQQASSKTTFVFALVGLFIFSCGLAAVFFGREGGGSTGTLISRPLMRLFDTLGAALILTALFLLSLAISMQRSVGRIVKVSLEGAVWLLIFCFVSVPLIVFYLIRVGIDGVVALMSWSLGPLKPLFFAPADEQHDDKQHQDEILPKPRIRKNRVPTSELPVNLKEDDGSRDESGDVVVERRKVVDIPPPKRATKRREGLEISSKVEAIGLGVGHKPYVAPDISLLVRGEIAPGKEDDDELREKSRQIESKLRDFAILGRVTHVHPGPVITLFEFEPAAGVKVGRIAALQDDLAMSLRASSIRIIAPIPRRGTVGIEVPNKHRDLVRLRDVLEHEGFFSAESTLTVPIGKDTYGEPLYTDISAMPHLLLAGATGTGKSVFINAMLLSLLYRATPEELGLILIDPKILELSVYEGIPHLKVPVVTHPRQAKAVLEWAINEMHRRYRMMQRFGVRNIDSYNSLARGDDPNPAEAKEASPQTRTDIIPLQESQVVEGGIIDPKTEEIETSQRATDSIASEEIKPLPKILIVIDELADLMLSVGREIEALITRLAQKARAAGIHLVIATQRPSVDVITGLIKANFPARLSFRVSSRIDSRTILDQSGADRLLGRGDMLFMIPGAEALKRVHGAFVSDAEVKRVIAFLKEQSSPSYDERIMEICEKALDEEKEEGSDQTAGPDGEYDAMYDQAVQLVTQKGYASTSMIQRVFRIGYNRAARIIDMMEKEGLVGPMDGAKPRTVLVGTQEQ